MATLIVVDTGVISTGITRQLAARGDRVAVANRGRPDADIVSIVPSSTMSAPPIASSRWPRGWSSASN